MSTPTDGDQPWQPPGQQPPAQPPGSNYGRPSSPSYGKYGQGEAVPTAPQQTPPGQQGWGPPGPGQYGPGQYGPGQYGQGQYGPGQQWNAARTVLQRSSSGLLTAITVLSALEAVTVCLVAILSPNQNRAFRDAIHAAEYPATSGPAPDPFTLSYSSGFERALSPINLLIGVALWVTVALWLTRARQNALVLNPQGQRRSETWVWLAWIIPIVNFWFPLQLLHDTARTTGWAAGQPHPKAGWWWASWLSLGLFGTVQALFLFLPPNKPVHLVLAVIEVVLAAVALTLWIRLIRWISATQDELAARQSGATLPG